MRALVAAVFLLMAAVLPLQAQTTPSLQPTGTIALAESGLLTFASGGDYLVVASGQQLELYDVRGASPARDVVTMSLDSAPLALTAAFNFALAAVGATSPDDSLLVIAPDQYSRGGFGIVNVLAIPKGTHLIVLSPDKTWGLAASDTTYVTMALSAADDIQISAPFPTGETPLIGAALTNQSALLIFKNSNRVAAIPLNTSSQSRPRPNALTLDKPAVAIAISDDGTLGAVALEDNRLTLFDPTTLKIIRTLTLEDGLATELRFVTSGDQRLLALKIDQRPAIMLLDVSQPDVETLPGSLAVDQQARSLAAAGAKLAVSAASGVQIFSLGTPDS